MKNSEKNKNITPIIMVPGIGSSALYLNPNTKNQKSAVKIDGNFTKLFCKSNIAGSTAGILMGAKANAEKYINRLEMITAPFKVLACDDNGLPIENTGIDCFWNEPISHHISYTDSRKTAEPAVCKGLCNEAGAQNVYIFNYDFRLDAVEHAFQLSDFIDNVKNQKNTDKVTLVSASLGTCIVSAYIDIFKDKNDIKRTVFLDGAFNGVSVTKLFEKDLYIDSNIIFMFIEGLAECYKGSDVDFKSINNIVSKFKKPANKFINFLKILADKEHIESLYKKVLLPLAGNMPALWECVPYENFDKSIAEAQKSGYTKKESGIYKKLVRYHEIQGRLFENLKSIAESGVETAVICGYGFPGMPCTSEYKNTTDMLIDAKWASAGATTAEYAYKISDELKNTADNKKYFSADGMIYSGSCALPQNTWFCKYKQHMEFIYNSDINKFISYIAASDIEINIKSIKEKTGFGQFTQLDNNYKLKNIQQTKGA
ncbi:MAG: hypothetical protein LUG21_06860 [Clostridiales bacterium]|nr:hypothetical protein [Clostridiales bacterium]